MTLHCEIHRNDKAKDIDLLDSCRNHPTPSVITSAAHLCHHSPTP